MNIWNLPGWWLDIWESPWEGVLRETQEETWLEIEITQLTGIYNKTDHKEILFSFVCEIIGGEPVCTSECAEMRYFAKDEIPENLPRRHREIILDYMEDPESIIMKHQ
jgi:8-oxo-dGTP diphosphatase